METTLETSRHLYQAPLYRGNGGRWTPSFFEAAKDGSGGLTWDTGAVLGVLGFTYPCGDRTLLKEVRRRPWLSGVGPDGTIQGEEIPPHGRIWSEPEEIAKELERRLRNEALRVCEGRKEIYLLLSGGLDSRVAAGILGRLHREGELSVRPVGVTWGLEDSRDVVYSRAVAEKLGFEWVHVPIGVGDVMTNIEELCLEIGCQNPPLHLHGMGWFRQVSKDALVLAGSYGDSVGRAEFSGRHLLELNFLRPINSFGLIRREVLEAAQAGLEQDLRELHQRSGDQARYILCEHEMQGHYMRNMIAHVMSVIGQYCDMYQMFTDPEVYGYMWSIHPSLRDDRIYGALLERLDRGLARLPWARTNRALSGSTEGAVKGLRGDYHAYEGWLEGELYVRIAEGVDPDWYESTGLFEGGRVRELTRLVRDGQEGRGLYGFRPYEMWAWLASFRRLAEQLEEGGRPVRLSEGDLSSADSATGSIGDIERSRWQRWLSKSPRLYGISKVCLNPIRNIAKARRRRRLQEQAVREYPPEQ